MSQIKLTIYRRNPETKKKEFVRVATAETAFLPFGPVQDIMEAIDVESVIKLMNGQEVENKNDIAMSMAPAIVGAMKEITPILMDTFEDVTEDELRNCDTGEICRVVVEILAMAVKTMFSARAKKK